MSCTAYIVFTFHLSLHANFGQFKAKQVLYRLTPKIILRQIGRLRLCQTPFHNPLLHPTNKLFNSLHL